MGEHITRLFLHNKDHQDVLSDTSGKQFACQLSMCLIHVCHTTYCAGDALVFSMLKPHTQAKLKELAVRAHKHLHHHCQSWHPVYPHKHGQCVCAEPGL